MPFPARRLPSRWFARPLILSVAVSREAVFAEWRQKAAIVGGALLFTVLLMAALCAFVAQELRRRGRAERAALENERLMPGLRVEPVFGRRLLVLHLDAQDASGLGFASAATN